MSDADFICRLLVLPPLFVLDPFAPVVVFAWALRLGWVQDEYLLQPAFAGFASDGFLMIATTVYVVHVLADKVPVIGHALDAIGIALKPLALAFAGFWLANRLDPHSTLHWAALAIILLGGVPATMSLQTLRTKVRLGASVGTLGIVHPAISTMENFGGVILAYLAVMHPAAAVLLVLVVGIPIVWLSIIVVRAAGKILVGGARAIKSAVVNSPREANSRHIRSR